jgi:acid phosphatase
MIRKLLATVGLLAASLAPTVANIPPADGVPAAPTKVLTIIEENHSFSQMKNQMPYLFSLSQRYGYATQYYGVTHPSEPNYIAIAGGSTFGITDDQPPSVNAAKVGAAKSIFDQALNRGKTAKSYMESMGSNCQLTGSGSYAVKHNPWAFFSASRTRCNSFDIPASSFLSDARNNRLPNAGMLVPNQCNDAHNCSLAVADDWLRQRLPTVLASSDFTSGRLTVIVTADEDDHSAGNNVLTSVLNASLNGKVVTTRLNHYSLCGYYSYVLGAPLLEQSTTGFAAAFGI